MSRHTSFLIGTCGWAYPEDWKNVFYPADLKPAQYLDFYSQVFPTVELDSSFYYIPKKATVEKWVETTPPDFSFSAKINQEITHKSKLNLTKCQSVLRAYQENIAPLERSGKILSHLLQLPPSFSKEKYFDDFTNFINAWNVWRADQGKILAGSGYSEQSWHLVVEFRHKSWITPQIFDFLRDNQVTFCHVIEPLIPPLFDVHTTNLFYLRFHGYGSNPWWRYLFSDHEIKHWADQLRDVAENKKEVKIVSYFNNHYSGNAVKNAMDLLPLLDLVPMHPLDEIKSRIQNAHQQKKKKEDLIPERHSLDKWIKK